MTRTHTVYFDMDSLDALRAAYDGLQSDWLDRGPYMSSEAQDAGQRRLSLVASAVMLLAEPVPESFG